MSTNDVPGAKPENRDVLAMGCWAEAADPDDKSLIFVEAVEGGRVIYSMFDLLPDPPVEYRDSMPEDGFKAQFTYKPADLKSIRWTWHDKTVFPWDQVMAEFPPGTKHASASLQASAAKRVADALKLRAEAVRPRTVPFPQRAANAIMSGIRETISSLKP